MEYTKITWNSDILLNRQEYYHGTQKYAFHKNKTEQIYTFNNNLYIYSQSIRHLHQLKLQKWQWLLLAWIFLIIK